MTSAKLVILKGPRAALVDPDAHTHRVSGRAQSQLSGISRNPCTESAGIGVRIPPESLSAFGRTTHSIEENYNLDADLSGWS
jgi:hypothetical protein